MEEELSFLRRKVNRLEDMIYNLNDKIGVILEKFFSRRASQVSSMRNVLQEEEDICLSLVTQLKSCIITGGGGGSGSGLNVATTGAGSSRNSGSGFRNIASTTATRSGHDLRSPIPKVVMTRLQEKKIPPPPSQRTRPGPASKGRTTRSSAVSAPVPVSTFDDPLEEQEDDDGDGSCDFGRSAIVNVKSEPMDEFHDEFGQMEEVAAVEDDDQQVSEDESSGDSESSESNSNGEDDPEDPDYLASKEADPDYLIIKPRKRNRKRPPRKTPAKTYTKGRTFPSEEVARAQIKSEQQYELESRRETSKGMKLYYNCRADPKCPVKVHMIIDKNDVVHEFVCTDPSEHKHRKIIRIANVRGLTDEQKQVVHDVYVRGVRSRDEIQKQLEQRGFPGVPKHQIANHIITLKKHLYGDLSFLKTATSKSGNSSSSKAKKKKRIRIRRRDLYEEEEVQVEVTPDPSLLASASVLDDSLGFHKSAASESTGSGSLIH